MHKFDVKYTYDNYYEYYKFVLIKQRIIKDLIFCVLFVAVAIYWWVDKSESTDNKLLPILSLVFGIGMPMLNFVTIPMIKKQLRNRQHEIDTTHIVVTFNEEEVVYENQSEFSKENKEVVETSEPAEETVAVENTVNESTPVVEETKAEEVKEDDRIFTLKYNNFLSVKESKNLFMFYLDRQTVIILPKSTYTGYNDLSEFKNFILTKINPKRVKFIKEKRVEN